MLCSGFYAPSADVAFRFVIDPNEGVCRFVYMYAAGHVVARVPVGVLVELPHSCIRYGIRMLLGGKRIERRDKLNAGIPVERLERIVRTGFFQCAVFYMATLACERNVAVQRLASRLVNAVPPWRKVSLVEMVPLPEIAVPPSPKSGAPPMATSLPLPVIVPFKSIAVPPAK